MKSPKALLKIGNETFLECILKKANSVGLLSALVVTGPDHDAIVSSIPPNIRCIQNENYKDGQISSLRKGILELRDSPIGLMVWPVDQPLVSSKTIDLLVSEYKSERNALTIPVYNGRKGHPVIYSRSAMDTVLQLLPDQTGKDLQATYSDSTTLVEVSDSAVVIDIDTQEDYEKFVTSQLP